MDTMKVTILPDGSLKIETDAVSGPNHMNAERFLTDLASAVGGEQHRVRKTGQHAHTHSHGTHTHTH